MKKTVALTLCCLGLAGATHAQIINFGDLKLKKDKKTEQGTDNNTGGKEESGGAASLNLDSEKNQIQYLDEFLATDGTLYELELGGSSDVYTFSGKTLKKSALVQKGSTGESYQEVKTSDPVIKIDHGGLSNYYPNYGLAPTAWSSWRDKTKIVENHGAGKKFKDSDAIDYSGFMFFDGWAAYVNYSRYDNQANYKVNRINTVYCTNKNGLKGVSGGDLAEKIKAYLTAAETSGFVNKAANQLTAIDKAKNSIEGKAVKSIKVKLADGTTKVGVTEEKGLVIEATLEDGTVLSTANGAYMSDYEIKATGALSTSLGAGKVKPIAGEGSLIFDLNDVKDEIVVTVKSKFHPQLKGETLKLGIDYSKRVVMEYSGSEYGRLAGIAAVIEVKAVKSTVDGSTLLEYRMRYRDESTWYQVFRVKPETEVFFKSNGATKAFKAEKHGVNGGVGGDLVLVVDPSVSTYKLTYSLKGAPGQMTKSAGYSHGLPGADGNFKVEKRSVSW